MNCYRAKANKWETRGVIAHICWPRDDPETHSSALSERINAVEKETLRTAAL